MTNPDTCVDFELTPEENASRIAWLETLSAPRLPSEPDKEEWTKDEWQAMSLRHRELTLFDWHGEEKMGRMYRRHLETLNRKGAVKVYARDRKRKSLASEELPIDQTFRYDPLTGRITRRALNIAVERVDPRGYVYVRYSTEAVSAARLAWMLIYGEWPKGRVKWINGDTQDNRLVNLRVGYNPIKRYQAQVMRDGVRVSLGYFETKHDRDAAVMNYRLGLTS